MYSPAPAEFAKSKIGADRERNWRITTRTLVVALITEGRLRARNNKGVEHFRANAREIFALVLFSLLFNFY
jgi:hypothetical protein